MKDYTSSEPNFSLTIQVVETTDPAHADNINAAPKQLIQNDIVLASILDADLVEMAFKEVFPYIGLETDSNAMSSEEIAEALNTVWDGEASADSNAMTPSEIETAIAEGSI